MLSSLRRRKCWYSARRAIAGESLGVDEVVGGELVVGEKGDDAVVGDEVVVGDVV